ncbi:FliM/FliN family flagellar motor switch protein [Sphingomonas sp. Leaf4]|uniref:FliM/FliN family flagellar motor switch protein n=1 Tax=Sphingomonas sp. Leaf4 TaxID=2876553 RepID=UPI001E4E672B|nr:FliM/FliN family flagellar motor switch protein [Sphingomonas sp. Leaf4]
MSDATPWLPAGAVPPASLHAGLAARVERWAGRWFALRPPALQAPVRGSPAGLQWRGSGGVMIGTAVDAMIAIGARMLDVPAEDRSEAERQLLAEVAEPCLAELRTLIAERGDWRPVTTLPAWSATIGEVLAIGWSAGQFATLIRQGLPAAAPSPFASPVPALAALRVRVGAAAGRVAMTVADLAALAPGDVVVLDTGVADPLPITLNGRAAARGRVMVVAADPAPFLKIVEPLG